MLVSVRPRLKELVALSIIYSIALLLAGPLVPVRAAAGPEPRPRDAFQSVQAPSHRSNEVLVRFRPNASENAKNVAAVSHGARRKDRLRGDSSVETFELTTAGDAVSTALRLNLDPAVEFAEPNFLVKGDQLSGVTPSDPQFAEQWSLANTGQNSGNYGSDANVSKAKLRPRQMFRSVMTRLAIALQ